MRRCAFLTGRGSRRRTRRTRRGVGYVWFAVIGMPVLFFVAALTTDITRIVISHRQMVLVTEAAANAGAATLDGTTGTGQAAEAVTAAKNVYQGNIDANAVDFLASTPAPSLVVTVDAAETVVTVSVTYDVDGLRFIRFFRGSDDSESFRVVRASSICEPGARPATANHCARPT